MRSLSFVVVTSVVLSSASVAWAESASATVVVSATFNSRTSLSVSTDVLRFEVISSGEPALAAVEFSARARTAIGVPVVLSVERLQEVQESGGPATAESSLTFSGLGEGALSGSVATTGSTVAARWTGGGSRHGQLVFALRTSTCGTYSIPVRFVLSAP